MKPTPDEFKQRREAKEVVRERLEMFRELPPMQQLKHADLIADEIVGAVIALTARHA